MIERRRLRVTGRVQGVWYRGSAQAEARRLGLHGWVRNLPDGTVEALAEGETEAVQAFVAWCRVGPPGAWVARVEETAESAAGDLQGFKIRH